MVSHKSISSSGAAGSYYKDQVQDKDSYYAKEEAGEWVGQGAEALKLTGTVDRKDFENVLDGKTPDGEKQLVKRPQLKDKETEEPLFNKDGSPCIRAGYDFTWTPDKTYSIAAVAYKDERLIEAMKDAQMEAIKYAVSSGLIQSHGEKSNTPIEGLVSARFDHSLSRDNDPNFHIHTVIANTGQRADGTWSALDFKDLVSNKYMLDQVADAHLAKTVKELGYAVEQGKDGSRLIGIDREVCVQFSKRSAAIEGKLTEYEAEGKLANANDRDKRQAATLDTRAQKANISEAELVKSWREQHTELGTTPEQQQAKLTEAGQKQKDHEAHNEAKSAQECVLQSSRGLTETEAVFTRNNLMIDALKAGKGTYIVQDIEKAVTELTKEGKLYELETENSKRDGSTRMTTPEIYEAERTVIKNVQETADTMKAICTKEEAREAIASFEARKSIETGKDFKLTDGQKAATEHMLTSTDQFLGVQGYAGTGKTKSMECFREVAEGKGYVVIGLTPTAAAANELEKGAGIESKTIHSFLSQYERKEGAAFFSNENFEKTKGRVDCPDKVVMVIDEASMVDARLMVKLMDVAKEAGAQTTLAGDTAQLQAVGAGGVFKSMQDEERFRVAVVDEILRQKKDSVEKQIVEAIAGKHSDMAHELKMDNGMIQVVTDRDERIQVAAKAYLESGINNTLLITDKNNDRNDLNQAVRDLRIERGEIEAGKGFITREDARLTPAERLSSYNYGIGDIVVNQGGLEDIKKGAEGRITGVNSEANTITVEFIDKKAAAIDVKEVDLSKDGENFGLYHERVTNLAVGDKIKFTKNDKGVGVVNNEVGIISKIDAKGNFIAEGDKGKITNSSVKQLPYMTHAYAGTDYSFQGVTKPNVIVFDDKGSSMNSIYVKDSRIEEGIKYITGDAELLKNKARAEQEKSSTLGLEVRAQKEEQKTQQKATAAEAQKTKGLTPKAAEQPKGKGQAAARQAAKATAQPKTTDQEQAKADQEKAPLTPSKQSYLKAFKGQVKDMLKSAKDFYDKHRHPEKYAELAAFAKEAERNPAAVIPNFEQGKGGPQIVTPEASRHLVIGNLEARPHLSPEIFGGLHKKGYATLTLQTLDGKSVTVDVQKEFAVDKALDKADAGKIKGGLETVREAKVIGEELKRDVAKTAAPTNHTEAAKLLDTPAGKGESKPEITANGATVTRAPAAPETGKETTDTKAPETSRGIEDTTGTRTTSSTKSSANQTTQRAQTQAAETSRDSGQTASKGGEGRGR